MEGSGQVHVPAALPSGKNTSTHWIGGCVAPRNSVDGFGEEKISCLCWDSGLRPSSSWLVVVENLEIPGWGGLQLRSFRAILQYFMRLLVGSENEVKRTGHTHTHTHARVLPPDLMILLLFNPQAFCFWTVRITGMREQPHFCPLQCFFFFSFWYCIEYGAHLPAIGRKLPCLQ